MAVKKKLLTFTLLTENLNGGFFVKFDSKFIWASSSGAWWYADIFNIPRLTPNLHEERCPRVFCAKCSPHMNSKKVFCFCTSLPFELELYYDHLKCCFIKKYNFIPPFSLMSSCPGNTSASSENRNWTRNTNFISELLKIFSFVVQY